MGSSSSKDDPYLPEGQSSTAGSSSLDTSTVADQEGDWRSKMLSGSGSGAGSRNPSLTREGAGSRSSKAEVVNAELPLATAPRSPNSAWSAVGTGTKSPKTP